MVSNHFLVLQTKEVIEINKFYPSSRVCGCCESINQDLTLKDRIWTCKNCNTTHNRDELASRNIALEGAREYFKNKECSKHSSGEQISLEMVLQNIKSSWLGEAVKFCH